MWGSTGIDGSIKGKISSPISSKLVKQTLYIYVLHIQVVVQDPGVVTDQVPMVVQMEQQPDIEVEQIEIDNSVESILPMEGEHVIENT